MKTYTFITKSQDVIVTGRLSYDDEFFYVKDSVNTFVIPRANVIYYIH